MRTRLAFVLQSSSVLAPRLRPDSAAMGIDTIVEQERYDGLNRWRRNKATGIPRGWTARIRKAVIHDPPSVLSINGLPEG